jgi:hypothetical protein
MKEDRRLVKLLSLLLVRASRLLPKEGSALSCASFAFCTAKKDKRERYEGNNAASRALGPHIRFGFEFKARRLKLGAS